MPYLQGYSVEIISDDSPVRSFVRDGGDYVGLYHNSEYKLRLTNNHETRCDVSVWIDGEKVGVWRLNSFQDATIERPVDKSRRFTFVKEGSREARLGEITTDDPDNGLIKVVFQPEKKQYFPFVRSTNSFMVGFDGKSGSKRNVSYGSSNSGFTSNMTAPLHHFGSYQSGGTVLGNRSSQRFSTVEPLRSIDWTKQVTLHTRLVVSEPSYQEPEPPIVPLHGGSSNPIPRPIRETRLDDNWTLPDCHCLCHNCPCEDKIMPLRHKRKLPWDH